MLSIGKYYKKHRHCKDNKTIYRLAQTRSIAEEEKERSLVIVMFLYGSPMLIKSTVIEFLF